MGCGDGSFTLTVATLLNVKQIYGIDKARSRGIRAYVADLNVGTLPFPDDFFDVVSAFDVIEHLWNTDHFIEEACRVLRPGGFFILSTPNLASWVNRLLMLFGYLPMHYNCSFKVELERRPLQKSCGVCNHIRLYTPRALKRHLQHYGFEIVFSCGYPTAYTRSNTIVALVDMVLGRFESLAAGIFVVARKSFVNKYVEGIAG